MANLKPLTNDEGEVRELAEEDFARFVPLGKLPVELQELLSSTERTSPDDQPPSPHHSTP
jgi:hypothetical protein